MLTHPETIPQLADKDTSSTEDGLHRRLQQADLAFGLRILQSNYPQARRTGWYVQASDRGGVDRCSLFRSEARRYGGTEKRPRSDGP